MNHDISYMVLYALVVGLSLYNLYDQVPRAWSIETKSGPLATLALRIMLTAWAVFGTLIIVYFCTKKLAFT